MARSRYLVSEEQVKKALKIDSFRNLSKDKVIEFVSLIPRMDKDVAIAIINQFPAYGNFSINIISQLNVMCDRVLKSTDESHKTVIDSYKMTLTNLSEMQKSGNFTPEQQLEASRLMIEICDRISEIDADYRSYLERICRGSIAVLTGALVLGAAILGVSIKSRDIPVLDDNEDLNDDTDDDMDIDI